ncbi:MAG TPA: hypothetical protein VFO49_08100 [Nocardioides sp.]|nr:hypothetical protein [Nocardioides sp.]
MQTEVGPGTEARTTTWGSTRLGRAVAVLVIGTLATYGWLALGDTSYAGQPVGLAVNVRADSQMTEMCLMPKAPADTAGTICPGAAKKKARQFRRHKLGNAKGITIPRFMQRRIKKKWRSMHGKQVADGCCDWITDPLKSTACLVTNPVGAHRGVCDEGQRSVDRIMRSTSRIVLTCGASAVIGYQKGGGVWGAGTGGGLCLWALFMDTWYK